MSSRILDAILRYPTVSETDLAAYCDERNITSKGRVSGKYSIGLEEYVKDLLADSFDELDARDEEHARYLSYRGADDDPPDAMLANGEAIEVKKIKTKHGQIQLNSSTPHQKLRVDDSMINDTCRSCEDWGVKDMVYTIGSLSTGEVNFMWMVYGDVWNEDAVYQEISDDLYSMLEQEFEEYGFTETNELGRLNDVDAQHRNALRIRAMWIMEHPGGYFKQFVSDYKDKISNGSPLFVVMRKSRFEAFDEEKRRQARQASDITLTEVTAPDPMAADESIDCVLIEALR